MNNEHAFTDDCVISVAGFMGLLSFYCKSAFVSWQGGIYTQVVPLLSNIFLSKVDKALEPCLEDLGIVAFRYVHDCNFSGHRRLR